MFADLLTLAPTVVAVVVEEGEDISAVNRLQWPPLAADILTFVLQVTVDKDAGRMVLILVRET